uniref:BACK domain-containing protein n=1 Tax=Glossina pallidipes TaxID=7398 RepID=A0A1A9ZNW7_GLOPL
MLGMNSFQHSFVFHEVQALDAGFGSLYLGEIEIDDKSVISIIAAATFFHLDNIINKCTELMADTINADTVMSYYDAACHIDLMTALISSPDLYVIESEFSLYTMLRAWVYLRLHPKCDLEEFQGQKEYQQQQAQQPSLEMAAAFTGNDHSSHAIQSFFLKRNETSSFLLTLEGQQLDTQSRDDTLEFNMKSEQFAGGSARVGRLVLGPECQKWSCASIHSNLDLVLVRYSHFLKIRRYFASERKHWQYLQPESEFMIRASITSINSQRQPMFTQKVTIVNLSLHYIMLPFQNIHEIKFTPKRNDSSCLKFVLIAKLMQLQSIRSPHEQMLQSYSIECCDPYFELELEFVAAVILRGGPDSSYSCLEIHICWKVDNEAKMEPPIQTEYLRSGGAIILIFIVEGAKALLEKLEQSNPSKSTHQICKDCSEPFYFSVPFNATENFVDDIGMRPHVNINPCDVKTKSCSM